MRRTVPPSAEIEARIDQLLAVGVGENPRDTLSELARLGARLIIQRAVEDEFDAWLGRARYERRPADQGEQREEEETGLRNGFRPRRVQTAEGELAIEIPQVRQAAETFASKLFPRTPKLLRTEPLKALVIGAFVRGLSMRDVESLCEQAGLGKLSKSTASRMCEELKDRFEAFGRRDLYEIRLVALFLDATFKRRLVEMGSDFYCGSGVLVTKRERMARDLAIVEARRRGVPPAKLAEAHSMTVRRVHQIAADWDDLPSVPKDGFRVDTGEEVRRTLAAFEQAIADLAEIVTAADAQPHVRLGAITRTLDAHERRLKLMASAGFIAANLASPLVEQEVARLMQTVADVLRRHDVADEVIGELVTVARERMGSPARVIEGSAA